MSRSASWTHTPDSDTAAVFAQIWCMCGAGLLAEMTDGKATLTCECGRQFTATYGTDNAA